MHLCLETLCLAARRSAYLALSVAMCHIISWQMLTYSLLCCAVPSLVVASCIV